MKRQIIEINDDLCNGCGDCVPNCAEGALQIIDGKARLISDLFCDGLGACLGHCPMGAIDVIEREAEPYDEVRTMAENIVPAGAATIKAHLNHMRDHNETEYLQQAFQYLKDNNIPNPIENEDKEKKMAGHTGGGCPGSRMVDFGKTEPASGEPTGVRASQLSQWPVQLHLLSPIAPYLKGADLLLAADCTAFAVGDFHKDYLKDKALAIACPKLDSGQDSYLEKLVGMIDDAKINTLTVMIMEVPCCGGLIRLAQMAVEQAGRKIPVKQIVVSIQGEILSEDWV